MASVLLVNAFLSLNKPVARSSCPEVPSCVDWWPLLKGYSSCGVPKHDPLNKGCHQVLQATFVIGRIWFLFYFLSTGERLCESYINWTVKYSTSKYTFSKVHHSCSLFEVSKIYQVSLLWCRCSLERKMWALSRMHFVPSHDGTLSRHQYEIIIGTLADTAVELNECPIDGGQIHGTLSLKRILQVNCVSFLCDNWWI